MVHQAHLRRAAVIAVVFLCTPSMAQAQGNQRGNRQQQAQQRMQEQMRAIAANQPQLPSDPQLLSLHKEFIARAEKLALEFERKRQFDKAREVYESLVRLVPKYSKAEQGLSRVLSSQAKQDKKLTSVEANKLWQDSGVTLVEGMPVHIEVEGTWNVVYETGPKGIEIPEKMRPRDSRIKLGTLIAIIANSPSELNDQRPFVIEDGKDFVAKKTGRLFLRMFDVEPSDNDGKLFVLIHSTFKK